MGGLAELSEDEVYSWIGVTVAVCGNVLISVALNVQKFAHNRIKARQKSRSLQHIARTAGETTDEVTDNHGRSDDGFRDGFYPTEDAEEEDDDWSPPVVHRTKKKHYTQSRLWWLGILLMILGELGNFIAYGYAPASTIAPLGTVSLVANVLIAPLLLKEGFRKRDLLGILFAVFGAVVVVANSKSEEAKLSPEAIWEAMLQLRSIIYFPLIFAAQIFLMILSPQHGRRSILIDLGIAAISGGFTVLATKAISSMLSLTLYRMFTYPIAYFLTFVLITTAIVQVKYLNRSLQHFDSTEVIPTQFVTFTISAIAGSAVLYHDFDDIGVAKLFKFLLGCCIEFMGVYLITSERYKEVKLAPFDQLTPKPVSITDNDREIVLDSASMESSSDIPFYNHQARAQYTLDPLGDRHRPAPPHAAYSDDPHTPLLPTHHDSYSRTPPHVRLGSLHGIAASPKTILHQLIQHTTHPSRTGELITSGVQTALSAVGARGGAELGLGQVYENYGGSTKTSHLEDWEGFGHRRRKSSSASLSSPVTENQDPPSNLVHTTKKTTTFTDDGFLMD